MLFLTKSGYWYEIEVKISRADFINDAKKAYDVHNGLITERHSKSDLLKNGITKSPNYFYYAVLDGLIKEDEAPDYAGLIYVKNGWYSIQKIAPKLRKDKVDPNAMNLLDKFYHNMVNAKDDAIRSKREVNETHDKYSNVKELIAQQRNIEKNYTINHAINAFKSTCPHYKDYQCLISIDKHKRCGGCERITEFENILLE